MIISKVEATGYRCLRDVRQELQPYQILVGPNGSGKSVFLDVIGFLFDLFSVGLQGAVYRRTNNFFDLVWGRSGNFFRLAVETQSYAGNAISPRSARSVRYEMEARIGVNGDEVFLSSERLLDDAGESAMVRNGRQVSFRRETPADTTYDYDLSPQYSALGNFTPLPTGETAFPTVLRARDMLIAGARIVRLEPRLLQQPSPPGSVETSAYDGSSLARVAAQLRDSSVDVFGSWLEHVQTAIPDIASIRIVDRPEDRHRYLMVQYAGGVEVPQWMVSDGTLRLLALTLLAYLPDFHGVYLVEEPEIGLHPTAIETVMQSLSSVYDGQVLITSHSPLVLSLPRPDQLLCFQKNENGTTIIPGNEHPMLSQWKSGVNISDLFAAGVLG